MIAKTLTAIALIALSFSAHADDDSELAEAKMEVCISRSRQAEAVMNSRQRGRPMGLLLAALNEAIKNASPKVKDIVKANSLEIIKAAQEQPKFSTEEREAEAITEFGSQIMLKCVSE